MRIWTDLDNTLVNPVTDEAGYVTAILPRPGVQEFLTKLGNDGQLWMLTSATREHAERAMSILHPASKVFRGIVSREDMEPVEEQLSVVLYEPGLSPDERLSLWSDIRPIAPPGPVFDNFPVDSSVFYLKAAAVGIGPDEWIHVEHFGDGRMDRGGLKKAYLDFRKRYPNLIRMSGFKKQA
jgi:hypothetical protein